MSLRNSLHCAFTLIELLVVIAIISILAAILFPVFAQVREKARETACISNLKQIGLAVRQYVQDYDETFPIFQAYNKGMGGPAGGPPGSPTHLGVEDELMPYIKSVDVFKCPDDVGGPASSPLTYQAKYGSSYRFTKGCFTLIPGVNGSYEDDNPITTPALTAPQLALDAQFVVPAETRIMRDEMLPWFSPSSDPGGATYGYAGVGLANYYQQWHPRGGGFIFADGHAKFVTSAAAFDAMATTPDGQTCYLGCD